MPNGHRSRSAIPFSALSPGEAERITQLHGQPRWRQEEQQRIAEEAEALAREAAERGIYGRKETERLKRELEAARAQHAPHELSASDQPLVLEVLPGLRAPFTPLELINISKDYGFARKVYQKITGVIPSKLAIKEFQQLVDDTYPNIEEMATQSMEGRFRRQYTPFPEEGKTGRKVLPAVEAQVARQREDLLGPLPQPAPGETLQELKARARRELAISKRRDLLPAPAGADAAPPASLAWAERKIEAQHRMLGKYTKEAEQKVNRAIETGEIQTLADLDRFLPPGSIEDRAYPEIRQYISGTLEDYLGKEREAEVIAAQTPVASLDREHTFRRLEGLHRIEALKSRGVRVAPFNIHHKEAERLLRRSQEATEGRTAAQQERLARVQAAVPASEDIRGEWQQGRDVLRGLDTPVREQVEQHFNPYFEKMSAARAERADRQWEQKIRPSIMKTYSSMGIYGGPLVQSALAKAQKEHQDALRQEADILMHQAWRDASHDAQTQQQRAIERAQVHGRLSGQQQEQLLHLEAQAQPAAQQQKLHEQMDVTAMGQLAEQKQRQEERQIGEAERQFREETMHPLSMLQTQKAISQGLETPSMTTAMALPGVPTPPSGPNVLAGMLASQLAPATLGRAKGGRIRGKFAQGGMPSWAQIDPNQYRGQQERIAGDLENYQFDAGRNLLSRVAPYLMMAGQGQGHLAVGRGMAEHYDDQRLAYNKSLEAKQMAANLYGAMNKSLLDQRRFLADYEHQKAQHGIQQASLGESRRYHDMAAGETQRHHKAIEGFKEDQLRQAAEMAANTPLVLSKEDKKTIKELEEDYLKNQDLLDTINEAEGVYERLDTGPVLGPWIDSGWDTTASKLGVGTLDDISSAKGVNADIVVKAQQAFKNFPRAYQAMKTLERSKPGFAYTKKANKGRLASIKNLPLKNLEHITRKLKAFERKGAEISVFNKGESSALTPRDVTSPNLSKMSTEDLLKRREELMAQ